MADQTQRYRAMSRFTYANALVALVKYARAHPIPAFTFGPINVGALEQNGLTVSGPDLTGVSDVLSAVPGLVASPD